MTREWRHGSVELGDGYTVVGPDGTRVSRVDGVDFAVEGGYLNLRVPGVDHVQLVSAPAVRLITCTSGGLS